MKIKKWMSLFLVVTMMVTLFAACGKEEAPVAPETQTQTQAAATETQASETQAAEQPASTVNEYGYNVTWDDMAELNFLCISSGSGVVGLPEVEAAINEITEEEINAHVTMEVVEKVCRALNVTVDDISEFVD